MISTFLATMPAPAWGGHRRARFRVMPGYTDDLRFAMQSEVAVRLRMLNGEEFLSGVHSVDDEDETFEVYDPQAFGDRSRKRLRIHSIESLAVTDIEYPRSA